MKTTTGSRSPAALCAVVVALVAFLGFVTAAHAADFGLASFGTVGPTVMLPPAATPFATGAFSVDEDDDDAGESLPIDDTGAEPDEDDPGEGATGPTETGPIVVEMTAPEPEVKKNRFGAAFRARMVVIPDFVLNIICCREAKGTINKGFAADFVYRREVMKGKRSLRGFDLGVSFFWEDYRWGPRGVPCSAFEAGGNRASSTDPLNCSDYYDGNAGRINGVFFVEKGDPDRETEYRLQNFRAIGIEILFGGWWTLNPFLGIHVGAGLGPVKVLGKMVYFDTWATQTGQAPDQRTPCATDGVVPVKAAKPGTGCQEVGIEEDDVPPWVGVLRIYLGLQFKITTNIELFVDGGIGGPSIFHADAGARVVF